MRERQIPVHGERGFLNSLLEPIREAGGRIAEIIRPASHANAATDAYTIDVELPGVTADDVDVELVGPDTLVVRGTKRDARDAREARGDGFIFSERTFGSFQRAFQIPGDVDTDRIDADFADGVLTIQLPRKAEAARSIKVRRG
jgi:HSP20 family protein